MRSTMILLAIWAVLMVLVVVTSYLDTRSHNARARARSLVERVSK